MMNSVPIVKDICFVGGGHSHALVLRSWAMRPIPGVRLTLVSTSRQTPYSGMLPGLIAGHYSYDQIHIDLLRLCHWAGIRFIENTVTGIDLNSKQVQFDDRPPLGFDVLSLDTGSTPDLSVPGSAEFVTPVKPVSGFNARWEQLQLRLQESTDPSLSKAVSIGVVGSGAGGFELITAIRHRLKSTSARCYWFMRSSESMGGRAKQVGKLAEQAAIDADIEIVRGFDVVRVESGKLIAADGRQAMLDEIIWCTAATGPDWPSACGLDVDKRGFVSTNAELQSTSHEFVFATGDIGTQVDTPNAKAGVFAVRQAPVLLENLRSFLLGNRLKHFVPQSDFLSLMATGPQHAIASRGSIVLQGEWVWRWKNYIDQKFMDKFVDLPKLNMNESLNKLPKALASNATTVRCRGCGAKVGGNTLEQVLEDLLPDALSDNHSEWSPAGDTAVVDLPTTRLVQSVDQINAIVADPYILGRIAALHAMSDVFTLDATVHSAQVLITLPESEGAILERDLRLIMQGVLSALSEESCALIGGHTTQGSDMAVGLCINATIKFDSVNLPVKHNVTAGDAIIMTKPIGVGAVFAGVMQGVAHGVDVNAVVDSMLQSNRLAASVLRQHGCTVMTDVTGFGLLGHLQKLLESIELDAQLDLTQIPFFDGAVTLAGKGVRSSLWESNKLTVSRLDLTGLAHDELTMAAQDLLFDPQTSGGLVAVVPWDSYEACLNVLSTAGFLRAAFVGRLESHVNSDQHNGSCIRVGSSVMD